jgi:hypothetical protein
MLKEKEITKEIEKVFKDIIIKTGLIVPGDVTEQMREPLFSNKEYAKELDLVYVISTKNGDKYTLIFEIKSLGLPRYARLAANQLQEVIGMRNNVYGIFGAPYISEESERICRINGIGYIDLSGNCLLNFDNIYISVKGNPNLYPRNRTLKSIFSPKSSRILRVLLNNPGEKWYVKDLAKEAEVSLGLVSYVKNNLMNYEYIKEAEKQKIYLCEPDALLNKWTENYDYKKNKLMYYYSLDDIKDIEIKLADYCKSKNIRYAFSLTSGSSLIAPFLRYNVVFAYIDSSIESIKNDLNWKEVTTGANISILDPYDEGIFYGLQEINGLKVVSDVQLYLDLKSYKKRGEEAAEFLIEKRLRPKW